MKRYDPMIANDPWPSYSSYAEMEEEKDGEYVKYKDCVDKIAELENELSSIVAGLFSENDLAIRDLEQQLKMAEIFIKKATPSKLWSPYIIPRDIAFDIRDELLEQIKQLKGGAE
jgi:hypothetical protein